MPAITRRVGRSKVMMFKARSLGWSMTLKAEARVSHRDQTVDVMFSVKMLDALMFLMSFVQGKIYTLNTYSVNIVIYIEL